MGGWCLGLLTGLLGRRAVAATTVAVERTVLRHLEAYRLQLANSDPEGYAAISAIFADEQDHHDAFAFVSQGWAARWIDPAVTASTEAVIRAGMRV
jgi:ubiquinone biosynthesis monooxygenase Coq7